MNISGNGKKRRVVRRAPTIYYSATSRKTPTKVNWRPVSLALRLLLPVFLIIYLIYFSPLFKVREVIVSGNEHIDKNQIVRLVPAESNIFSLDIKSLEEKISSDISDIDSVKIYKGIPNAIKIVVRERSGSLLWQSGLSYYLVSTKGEAFRDVSSEVASYSQLPKVVDKRQLSVSIPVQIVSVNFVDFVNNIYSNIKPQTNLEPDYFLIDETTVDVWLYIKSGIYLKLDSFRSVEKQLQDLKLVLLEKKPEVKEYIDLRVSGWAYYK